MSTCEIMLYVVLAMHMLLCVYYMISVKKVRLDYEKIADLREEMGYLKGVTEMEPVIMELRESLGLLPTPPTTH